MLDHSSKAASRPLQPDHESATTSQLAPSAPDRWENERLLEAKDVAELLNVPVGWVREHTRTGSVPHVQLGRYVRYQRADVLAWVEGLKVGGPVFRRHRPRVVG
jgi:excisionase family DNA binding protein